MTVLGSTSGATYLLPNFFFFIFSAGAETKAHADLPKCHRPALRAVGHADLPKLRPRGFPHLVRVHADRHLVLVVWWSRAIHACLRPVQGRPHRAAHCCPRPAPLSAQPSLRGNKLRRWAGLACPSSVVIQRRRPWADVLVLSVRSLWV